ncbi:MAG TPA: ABC transporter ATP-binding protein [Pyrinomonadaceae bacterium]|nr:ABC transporter ATP-binding protein [Pyrinomonadaceae bacterium]
MRDLLTLLPYLKRYKKALVMGVLCTSVSTTLAMLVPFMVGRVIDDLLRETSWRTLTNYGVLIISLSLISGLMLFLQRRFLTGMAIHIEADLHHDLYAHLQHQTLSFFQSHRTGDLMAHMINDVIAVRQLTGPLIMYSLRMGFIVVITLILMLHISVRTTLLLFVTTPFISLTVKYLGHQVHTRFRRIQEFFSDMSARVQENFSAARLVRAYAQENAEAATFDALNRRYTQLNLGLVRRSALMQPVIQLFIQISYLLIIFYGSILVVRGTITIGQFAELNLYLTALVWALIVLGDLINLYQRGTASLKRLNTILNIKPAIRDRTNVKPQASVSGQIEFRNLDFSYGEDSAPVLHNINLTIKAGQTVAIVGPTASGKSTLINLLPRLLESPPNSILIDGVSIQDYPLIQLRSSIGYVPQETLLFSGTIAENIAFGNETANLADIEWAAEIAGMTEDVRGFPEGFETLVGERGITLSGGQKQRTAIARAILRQAQILILDDALSSVDTYTEKKILDGLREVMRNRTCIIVSHRTSTTREADMICVLDGGRIVEQGSHDELLARYGTYAALHRRQLLQEELIAELGPEAEREQV